jgi:hypothetical protein
VPGCDLAHGIYTALGKIAASAELRNFLQIVPAEDATMSRIEYLQDQVIRAERLATPALDKLTVDRLCAFAEDCRKQISALSRGSSRHGSELAEHQPAIEASRR